MNVLKDLIEIDLDCGRAVFIGNKKQVEELKRLIETNRGAG